MHQRLSRDFSFYSFDLALHYYIFSHLPGAMSIGLYTIILFLLL